MTLLCLDLLCDQTCVESHANDLFRCVSCAVFYPVFLLVEELRKYFQVFSTVQKYTVFNFLKVTFAFIFLNMIFFHFLLIFSLSLSFHLVKILFFKKCHYFLCESDAFKHNSRPTRLVCIVVVM